MWSSVKKTNCPLNLKTTLVNGTTIKFQSYLGVTASAIPQPAKQDFFLEKRGKIIIILTVIYISNYSKSPRSGL